MRWRRTVIAGEWTEEDWSLSDRHGEQLARLYRHWSGRWQWGAGSSGNNVGGMVDTGREAREACEAVLRARGLMPPENKP